MLKQIPFYAVLLSRKLSDGSKVKSGMVLVYGAIEQHSFGEKGCIASNKTIAKECGLKESSVSTYISLINKAGWVRVVLDENNHRKRIEPLLEIYAPPFTTVKPPLYPGKTPPLLQSNIGNSNKVTVRETTTKVVGLTPEYGKPELNKLFEEWERLIGYKIQANVKKNRYSANTLLKKFGLEEMLKVVSAVAVAQGDVYAPRIGDFVELQAKWNSLMAWGKNHQIKHRTKARGVDFDEPSNQ